MADSENDKSSSSEANNLGAGKDVLFGWLVGRAAADLGLAQALAASEAQRAEQLKRLEVSLLAQIHQLQQQQAVGANLDDQTPELHELKAQQQSFSERLSGVESAAQQATQMRERVNTEMSMLHSQLGDRQNLFEAQRLRLESLEANIGAKIGELELVIGTKAQSFDAADHDLKGIRQELTAMTDRVARTELVAQHAQIQAARDIEHSQARTASLVTSECAALKAELSERLEQPAPHSVIEQVEEIFHKRLDDLHRELGQNFFARIDAEVQRLHAQVQSLTERVESVSLRTTTPIDFDAERSRWSRETDERIAVRLQELSNEIRDKLQTIASVKVESDHFLAETGALAHRLAQNEQVTRETTAGFAEELSTIKAGLSRQENQQQATQGLLKNVEETVRTKIREIQDFLIQEQHSLQSRDGQLTELKIELPRLAQRIAEVESMTHQTHALMVNENEQAAQQKEGFITELATLRGQLGERQSMDEVMLGVEKNLSVKIRELQNQLAQKMLVIDSRDNEFKELKAQLQTLTQKMVQAATPSPSVQTFAATRLKENVVVPVDISALRSPPADRLNAVSVKLESTRHGTPALFPENTGPRGSLLDEAKDQLSELQRRMSADIERARAELREKSGRGKMRG